MSSEPKTAPGQNTPTGGVRLITWNTTDEKLELFPEGLKMLEQLADETLCVLAVTGRNKTGKTFLSERVFLEHKPLGVVGSSVLSTIQKGTQGMTIYTSSDFKTADSGVRIVLIDTEGLGATHCSAQGQSRMFAVALLLSSCLIYNSFGAIDEGALEGIEFVAQLAQELKSESGYSGVMPEFHWLLRDFSLRLEELGGKKMTAEDYLESCLELSKGTSDTIEKRNKTRRVIKHLFPTRDCSTMVRPTLTEFEMQRLFSLKNSDLRAEFAEQARKLRTRITRKIMPKRIAGKECTGSMLAVFLQTVVEALNSRHTINLPSLHQRALETIKAPVSSLSMSDGVAAHQAVVDTLQGRIEALTDELKYWKDVRVRSATTQTTQTDEALLEQTVLSQLSVSGKLGVSGCLQTEVWGLDRNIHIRPKDRPALTLWVGQSVSVNVRGGQESRTVEDARIQKELQQRLAQLEAETAGLQRMRVQDAAELREVRAAHGQAVELLAAAQIKLKEFDTVLTQARDEKNAALGEKEKFAGLLEAEKTKVIELSAKIVSTPAATAIKSSSDWKCMLEEKAAAFICLDCSASIPAQEFLEHHCNTTAGRTEGAVFSPTANSRSRAGLNTSGLAHTGMVHHANLNTSSCLDSSVLTIRRTPTQAARRTAGLPDGAGAILTQNYVISAGDDSATPRRLPSKCMLQAEIVEVNVKESVHNKKLYAEYRIKATRGKKVWESYKKYREFCEFASGISTWIDQSLIVTMPDSVQSIFKMVNQRSQIGTSTIADRQTQLQDLLNWVCQDSRMSDSPQLREFLQEPEVTDEDGLVDNLLPDDILSEGTKLLEMDKADSKAKDSNSNQTALLQVLSRKQNFGSVVSNPTTKPKNLTDSPKNPNSSVKKETYQSAGLSLLRASASSYLTNSNQSAGTAGRSKKVVLHTQSTDRNDETVQSVSKRTTDEFKRGALFPDDAPHRAAGTSLSGKTANGSRASSQQKLKQPSMQLGGKLVSNKPKQTAPEPASPGVMTLGSRKKSTPQMPSRLSQHVVKLNEAAGGPSQPVQPSTPVFKGVDAQLSESIVSAGGDYQNASSLSKGNKPHKGAASTASLFSSPQIGSAVRGLVGPGLAKQLQVTSGTQPRPLTFTTTEQAAAGRRVGVLKHLK